MAAKLEAMDAFSGLAERLVEGRLCGEVATPVGSCVGNCRQLVAGHPDYTFGLSDWATATYDEAVAALEALGGGRLRDHPDHAPAYIDPAGTVAWQPVEGGLAYLSADHTLHVLRGAGDAAQPKP